MKKKVIFYARSGQRTLYPKVAKKLDIESFFIVQNSFDEKQVKKLTPDNSIFNLTQFISDNWNNDTLLAATKISVLENKYNIESIWKLFYTDRFLINYSFEESVKFIKLHFLFAESVFNVTSPKYFVNEDVALFSAYVFYEVCKFYNCKYVGFSVPRNLSDRKILFTNTPDSHYPELDYYYKKNKFTELELERAITFLKEIRTKGIKPDYMKISGKLPKFRMSFFLNIMQYFYHKYGYTREKFNYESINLPNNTLILVRNYFKYKFQKKYYKDEIEDQKYILFPLHFQPEASTLVRAPKYEKQLYTIDLLAKNIPGDHILYVKEHYAFLGHRDNYFYKSLKKYPNVRLINPLVDSHKLIKSAEAVVVLTSTVGWEALLFNKPVFILGSVFYETFKYARKLDNIESLPLLLKQITISEEDYEYEIVRYFAAYLKAMKDGNYYLSINCEEEENINRLVNSLKTQL